MRIAQVAPLYESVPPRLYGGTERVVAYLADALSDAGHDVTLFASAGSKTKARLVPARECAIRLDTRPLKSDVAAHLAMLHQVRKNESKFDIIHVHLDLLHFPVFEDIALKTITTLHGRLDLVDLPQIHDLWSDFALVSISRGQRQQLPAVNWAGTVYHGLPAGLLRPPSEVPGKHLVFLGRISPEKRVDRAIRIAKGSNSMLKIAAKVDMADRGYYLAKIEPLIEDSVVEFVGEIGESEKSAFLGNAAGLLFPIDWPEPFGLVLIEAMACGTPVIAWNCGAVSEIVEDGVTGFVVESEDEAVAAVERLPSLSRETIRHTFEKRFSAATMAREYVALYRRIVMGGDAHPPLGAAVAAP